MRVKSWVGAAAAAGLVAGFGVLGVAPAAASTSLTLYCPYGNVPVEDTSIVLAPGDTLAITPTGSCTSSGLVSHFGSAGTMQYDDRNGTTFVTDTIETVFELTSVLFTAGMDEGEDLVAIGGYPSAGDYFVMRYHIRVCNNGECPTETGAASTSETGPIPGWVQAYARNHDATCETGWDSSWQEWAVPVSGGWVCTRTIPSLG